MKMNKQDLMDMHAIQALTDADMQKVNQAILAQINSDVPMVNQLGFYIVQGGGKRIRPLIAVLAARALGYESDKVATCATFVEFIHTASYYMMMWWMNLICVVVAQRQTLPLVMRLAY